MKVYVIRHGQTELNVKGLINGQLEDALTAEGMEQAKIAAKSLPKTIKHLYVSPLNRARQTAEILNAELNLPITFHDELKEVNFGELQGTPYLDEYKKRHGALDYDWGPSGENVGQVKERVLRILRDIKNDSGDGEALIVAHGGIVYLLNFLESGETLGPVGNASLHSFDIDKILA